ncbi:MAG: response regulator [Methylibium sp.]|uniref:ATP-binding response regulator n=1 Tax=Methylibium sp. TaxID=2067992 RepID=UPI0017F6BEED|nr:ATP-binding protein [Methylibium sp.]MBA3597962.1 response regulator [Methylibium sp.]
MNATLAVAPSHSSGQTSVLVWSAAPLETGVKEALDAAVQGTGGLLLIHHDCDAALALLARSDGSAGLAGQPASEPPSLPDPVALVVLVVQQLDQVGTARALARAAPKAGCMVLMSAAHEPALRRALMFSTPTGTSWHLERADDPLLCERIHAALMQHVHGQRLRTTLDRMKLSLTRPSPVEASEHRRLVASDLLLGSVLRHASDAIVSLDDHQRIQSWNDGARRLFGRDASRVLGTRLSELFDSPGDVTALFNEAAGQAGRKAEWSARVGPQSKIIEATLDGIPDDAGRRIGVLAILRDVTAQRRNERELVAASRQKDEFLAMLGHELRNPLSPIRNAAEILRLTDKGSDPRVRRASDIIARQVKHLSGLVDDLLDVARVTRGAITLNKNNCHVAAVVAAGIEQARSLIDAKHQELQVHVDESCMVLGDRERLTQVFSNLINNAAKYTGERGAIVVHVSADEARVKVSVSDTGVGIAPELLPRVFDLFIQGARSADRTQGGLGIGLSLVKSLVEAHGGSVVGQSPGLNRGSTFTVTLPRALGDEQFNGAPAGAPFPAGNRLRLMVVDDNSDAADTLGMLLEAQGHEVNVQHDPLDALARAEEMAPDVFILDIGMPRMDGYELAKRLRQLHAGSHAVLIALTGYGQPEDRLASRRAGFDHHLVKPLDAAQLRGLLEHIVPTTRH